MKIITGGTGFIGSAICWLFNKNGISDVILVDEDINGSKKNNIENLKFTDFIEKNDFLKQVNSGKSFGKVDAVYHMGACSSTTEQNMEYLRENNVEYSKQLGMWCMKNAFKYIYASSGATYGDGSMGFDDSNELAPSLKPLNKYGLSKQLFDIWVLENKYDKVFAGLKYFNVFGPNENHKGDMRSMINKTYAQVMETGKLKLFKSYIPEFKDGQQKRDFIYIKDAADMTLYFDPAIGKGKDVTGIYNIGSGKASTWIEMGTALFNALGKEVNIEFIEMPDSIKNQYQYFTEAKMDKLRNTGYDKKCMTLNDSVKDYVVNYLVPGNYLSS
jgi:ADP-L-glycero-D-manno-heptose 6-epimerase